MKRTFFIMLFVLTAGLLAKDIVIEDTRVLVNDTNSPFYFPVYTADGESILMTSQAYTGLWIMNRSSEEVSLLTNAQGAGFQPRSLPDGSIIYRHDEYEKGRKFTSLYKADATGKKRIAPGARFVSPANMVNDRMIYLNGETLTILHGAKGQFESNLSDYTTILNDRLTLKLFQGGVATILAPQGDGNYIWSEMSPAGDKLVYAKTGEGTFVCDLQGVVLADLGAAHAPQWSPDGEYLVYMDDRDDGTQYTHSEIWIVSHDGKNSWQITDTPDVIEMYPQWSPNGKHLIYHTAQGRIMETSVEIGEEMR